MTNRFGRYLIIVFVVVLLTVGHVGVINYIYDPWWHFDGNKVGIKYSFHESEAKVNRLKYDHRVGRDYDCLVLGSSRVLTFNTHRIKSHSCYNFSISSGTYPRLLANGRFFNKLFGEPKLVIMGIDNWQFTRKLSSKLEVSDIEDPAPWYMSYFALDALRFSKRIANKHRVIIGYEDDWKPTVGIRGSKSYPIQRGWKQVHGAFKEKKNVTYYPKNLLWLPLFREVFPNAKLVGFSTPLTADLLVNIHAEGGLNNYTGIIHEAAKYFDVFHDFVLPNELNIDVRNTWDGSHYKPLYTDYVVRAVLENEQGLSVNVKAESLNEYRTRYFQAISKLMIRHTPEVLFTLQPIDGGELINARASLKSVKHQVPSID